MLIAVVNQSTKVTPTEASVMTRAVAFGGSHHLAPSWRIAAPPIIFYHRADEVPPGAIVALIADNPDQAGALGYHDQGPDGLPYIRVFVDPVESEGGTVLGPQSGDVTNAVSLSSVLDHEYKETAGDAECNLWAQRPDGLLICRELGDPVQGSSYGVPVTTGRTKVNVLLSNFVLPAWFDPQPSAGDRFDYLGHVSAPFTLEHGGYQIWTDGKKYGNQFADAATVEELAPRAMDKLHPMARTRRRYDALEAMGATAHREPTLQ